jgi:hypothetical protein
MSRQQTSGQNHNIKVAKKSFENMAKLRQLVTTITNQNYIQEEIKNRFTSDAVQNLLSSLLSKT